MDFTSAMRIIEATIISVGGAGAIIIAIANFLANRIASRLEDRYQLKLDKELEQYKASLEQRTYVTKTQFDIELEVYRKLSKGIFEFIVVLNTTIEDKDYPKKEDMHSAQKLDNESNTFKKMVEKAAYMQELIYENAAFMPKCLYDEYVSLIELATDQFWVYHHQFQEYLAGNITQKERVTKADKEKLEILKQRYDTLNQNLRDYLQKVYIVK